MIDLHKVDIVIIAIPSAPGRTGAHGERCLPDQRDSLTHGAWRV